MSKPTPNRLWKMASPPMLGYRPPFSAHRELHDPQDVAPGERMVPKPMAASPCWADARLERTNNAKMVAKKASFLTEKPPMMIVYGGKMRPPNHLDASAWVLQLS